MADSKMTTDTMQNMMKTAQAALATGPVLGIQSQHFWQAQERLLTEFEAFSSGWFKRRHVALQDAVEASKQITSGAAKDPATAMSAVTKWQSNAMSRLAEDAQACAKMMANCTGALVQNEIAAVEETVTTTQRAMKQSKSEAL